MPSSAPTLANNFQVTGSDNLDEVLWNAVFGEIATLLKGLSDTFQTLEELEQSTINQSLAVIAQSVEPQVLALQQAIALAQAQVDDLIAAGVAAGSVSVAGIDGLDATNVQAALVELAGIIAALASVTTASINAVSFAGLRPVVSVAAAHTAVAGQRVYADSTGGAFDIKTPQDPAEGETFAIYPTALAVSVIPNDEGAATTIQGETSVTIDQTGVALELTHVGGVWKIARRSIING